MLVVLVASLDIGMRGRNTQVLELFAGQARISRLANAVGLRACALDAVYDKEAESINNSCFNINTDAGYVPYAQRFLRGSLPKKSPAPNKIGS